MFYALLLAVVVGMYHALEADHVAAVCSLMSGKNKPADMVRHGLSWGLGHMLTLFAVTGVVLLLGTQLSATSVGVLETAVGVMLVALGTHVLWRMWKDRVHFHVHSHADSTRHFHAHSHLPQTKIDPLQHRYVLHEHSHRFRWRTLFVGSLQGMAGSGALLVLAASQLTSVKAAVGYVLLFGFGSMVGMALVTAALSVPLAHTAGMLNAGHKLVQLTLGLVPIAVGMIKVMESGQIMFPSP